MGFKGTNVSHIVHYYSPLHFKCSNNQSASKFLQVKDIEKDQLIYLLKYVYFP